MNIAWLQQTSKLNI